MKGEKYPVTQCFRKTHLSVFMHDCMCLNVVIGNLFIFRLKVDIFCTYLVCAFSTRVVNPACNDRE